MDQNIHYCLFSRFHFTLQVKDYMQMFIAIFHFKIREKSKQKKDYKKYCINDDFYELQSKTDKGISWRSTAVRASYSLWSRSSLDFDSL